MLIRRNIFIMLAYLWFKTCNCILPAELSAKICHKNDPKLNNCLKQFLTAIVKGYPNGIPEMDLDSIDPLIMDNIKIDKNIIVGQLKMNMNNVTIVGLTTANIDAFSIDLKKLIVKLKLSIPSLQLAAGTMHAKFATLLFTKKSDAAVYANLTNIYMKLKLVLEDIQIDGNTYFKLKSLNLNTELDDVQIRLVSQKRKNQGKDNELVQMFNKFKSNIIYRMRPILESDIKKLFKKKIRLVLSTVPADELLPN